MQMPAGFKPQVGLEVGLFGFQILPVSEQEIVKFEGPNSSKTVQNPFKVVGRFAPHHFEWVLDGFRAV